MSNQENEEGINKAEAEYHEIRTNLAVIDSKMIDICERIGKIQETFDHKVKINNVVKSFQSFFLILVILLFCILLVRGFSLQY